MLDTPLMSLKTVNFTPAAFTPVQYTPNTADATLLGQSLEKQEARENTARQSSGALDESLMKFRMTLDPSEYAMFDERKNNIRQRINTQIALGNYQSALRMAQQEASDFAADSDLQNRQLTNTRRQQALQAVKSSNLYSPITKLRWEQENPYVYNGTGDWSAVWNPVEDVDLEKLWLLAAQATPEQSTGHSWSNAGNTTQTYVDIDGNITTDPSKAVGVKSTTTTTGSSGGSTVHQKTKENIEKTFYDMLQKPETRLALEQSFNNYMWAYNYYSNRANDQSLTQAEREEASRKVNEYKSEVTDENGFMYNSSDFNRWLDRKSKPMFKDLSYRNTTSQSGTGNASTVLDSDFLLGNRRRELQGDAYIPEEVGALATPIRISYDWFQPIYSTFQFNPFFRYK